MKLVVKELDAIATEQIVTPSKNTVVKAIRPHIYRHNFPAGSLKLEVYDDEDTLVAESNNVAIDDIGSMDYFHGYVRFDVSIYMRKNVPYRIKLVGEDGYSFDESAYCGWVNGHDLATYQASSVPASVWRYPLDLEIWERTVK